MWVGGGRLFWVASLAASWFQDYLTGSWTSSCKRIQKAFPLNVKREIGTALNSILGVRQMLYSASMQVLTNWSKQLCVKPEKTATHNGHHSLMLCCADSTAVLEDSTVDHLILISSPWPSGTERTRARTFSNCV